MSGVATQTEREQAFASSTAILRSLAEGVLVVDLNGIIRQLNPAAAQLLGVDQEVLLDQALEAIPGGAAMRQHPEPQSEQIVAGDRLVGFQKLPLFADDDKQHVQGTIFLLRDLTNQAAEQRQQYDYFCRALHDVRVPLQAISGAAEGLLRGWFGPLTDDQREFAGLIKENADHQGQLFSQLYDVYALSTHFVAVQTEPISIESVIHEIEQQLAPRFAARQQTLTVELAPDLPAIAGDRARLGQVLVALLSNAHRYTRPGGAALLRAQPLSDAVLIEVQDSGVGISDADQPHMFTPFFRGNNPLKEGRYGGLSLVIAKLLVEQHGGRIWFASTEDLGSTFSFTIPLA